MERIIESFDEFSKLNEKVIKPGKKGFTKNDIEEILKKSGDILLNSNGVKYFVTPHMHNKGKLEKGDDEIFYPLNVNGKPIQVKFYDIDTVTI